MATLVDHKTQSKTPGAVANLTEFMVTEASATPHARRLKGSGRERYSVALVKSAIRRGGRVEGLELQMSDAERAAWELANPLPQ